MTARVTAAAEAASSDGGSRSGTTTKPRSRNDSARSAETRDVRTALVCWQTRRDHGRPPPPASFAVIATQAGAPSDPVPDVGDVGSRHWSGPVCAPVPRLARQVEEAERGCVRGHPVEARARAAGHGLACALEVDGQAPFVHGRAGDRGRRRAAAGRHLVDRVLRGSTVLDAQPDLLVPVSVATTAQVDAVAPRREHHRLDVVRQRAVDGDRAASGTRYGGTRAGGEAGGGGGPRRPPPCGG